MPIACLAIAALVAFAVQGFLDGELLPSGREVAVPAVAVGAIALVVFAADLHFNALKATAADEGNKAYKALAKTPKDAQMVEIPVFLPDVNLGSVYQYYGTVARRKRPSGYSTTAPVIADVTARRLRPINCGDWTHQPGVWLKTLGIREIAFHNAPFRTSSLVALPRVVRVARPRAARLPAVRARRRDHDPRPLSRARPAAEGAGRRAQPVRGMALLGLVPERRQRARDVVSPLGALGLRKRRPPADAVERRPRRPFLGRRKGDADPEARAAGRVDPAPTREARLAPRHPGHAGRCRTWADARRARGSSRTCSVDLPPRPG